MFVSKKKKMNYVLYLTAKNHYRPITKADRNSVRVEVLVLESKGNPPWDSYQGFHTEKADIGKVGDKYADIFLVESKQAVRIVYGNGKILVRR